MKGEEHILVNFPIDTSLKKKAHSAMEAKNLKHNFKKAMAKLEMQLCQIWAQKKLKTSDLSFMSGWLIFLEWQKRDVKFGNNPFNKKEKKSHGIYPEVA